MKKYLSVASFFLITGILSGCSLNPTTSTGVGTGNVPVIAASSIMQTTDAGKKWEPKGKTADKVSLASIDILSIAINPFDEKNVFVGTLKNGIVKTDNGGEDWNLLNFPAEKVYGLVIDNMQGSTLYATGVWQGRGKIFKSIDGGKEWNEIYTAPSNGPLVISLAMDKLKSNILYASTSDKQVMKSLDGGSSWQNILSTAGPVTRIVMDSANTNLIYLLMLGGNILKSSDGGKTVTSIAKNIGNGTETIEADPTISQVLYAGGSNGLFRSRNAGESWDEIKTLGDSQSFPVRAVAISSINPNEMMYGSAQAVYKSVDGGQYWTSFQLDTKKTVSIIRYNKDTANMAYLGLRDK
ncbi:MAG: hypothetical protein WC823_06040 [Parcubacteria group bacterium]|jgi:photosystem II stability/assembly factor-like uncharacterized protein